MLSLPSSIRIFLAREPVDFRKAHDGLLAIVRDEFGDDPFDGSIFVFLNRRADRVKVLHWDRDGFWLHYKRLEEGTFRLDVNGSERRAEITRPQLMMLLEGIDLKEVGFVKHTHPLHVDFHVRAVGMKAAADLPDDVDALKAIVTGLREKVAVLEHNVEVFRRLAFGASTEKRRSQTEAPEDPNQGHLFYAELVEEAQRTSERCGTEGTIEQISSGSPRPKKAGGRRKKFPPHLPVIRTTYELPESDRVCACGGKLHEFGEDVRRELERIEVTLVHEIACKNYGCRSCEIGVKTAPGPERVIQKGILGKGFLAHVIVERFQNHMPYYRLEKKYASEGLDLSRSVLQRSMARVAELVEPIANQLRREVPATPRPSYCDASTTSMPCAAPTAEAAAASSP